MVLNKNRNLVLNGLINSKSLITFMSILLGKINGSECPLIGAPPGIEGKGTTSTENGMASTLQKDVAARQCDAMELVLTVKKSGESGPFHRVKLPGEIIAKGQSEKKALLEKCWQILVNAIPTTLEEATARQSNSMLLILSLERESIPIKLPEQIIPKSESEKSALFKKLEQILSTVLKEESRINSIQGSDYNEKDKQDFLEVAWACFFSMEGTGIKLLEYTSAGKAVLLDACEMIAIHAKETHFKGERDAYLLRRHVLPLEMLIANTELCRADTSGLEVLNICPWIKVGGTVLRVFFFNKHKMVFNTEQVTTSLSDGTKSKLEDIMICTDNRTKKTPDHVVRFSLTPVWSIPIPPSQRNYKEGRLAFKILQAVFAADSFLPGYFLRNRLSYYRINFREILKRSMPLLKIEGLLNANTASKMALIGFEPEENLLSPVYLSGFPHGACYDLKPDDAGYVLSNGIRLSVLALREENVRAFLRDRRIPEECVRGIPDRKIKIKVTKEDLVREGIIQP